MTNHEKFQELNLKMGDKVVINQKIQEGENGSKIRWWTNPMDDFIGQEVTIKAIYISECGYGVEETNYNFPALSFSDPIDPEKRKNTLNKIRSQNNDK